MARPAPSEVTLVTGASSGIGRALAISLASRGDRVIVLARRAALLETLVEEITVAGGQARAVVADVTDRETLAAALAEATAHTGAITRLVANAGGGSRTDMTAYDAATIADILRLNVEGVVNSVGCVLAPMQAAGRGHIVVMGSLAATRGLPNAAAYSAAKAGVARFTESLAIDLAETGIDVTLLEPGFVTKPGKRVKWPRMAMTQAVERMSRAIVRRIPYWRGPSSLVFAAGILRLLPSRAYIRIMAGRGRR
ncbi:SDR family oxidoreductase [Salinisphaera sp. Q1T1-3]|uniref:SDR family NAD(P)-dependent oxidoreductase n=1 Tax=Salinisphaera sp. Q1T1-3 TaxID=2321229 RepID=UPI000E733DCC|nr:SDR family NAD(P)-dependent oxidoreductase [Salinisphaera sp. Q1T1-3]RJS92212.1 SDR family NAD(P)-dependent oxidoreductase [Salinisphaera sp. Q1T1-3]